RLDKKVHPHEIYEELTQIGHDHELVEASLHHVQKKRKHKHYTITAFVVVGLLAFLLAISNLFVTEQQTMLSGPQPVPIETITSNEPGVGVYHAALEQSLFGLINAYYEGEHLVFAQNGIVVYPKLINAKALNIIYDQEQGCVQPGSLQVYDNTQLLGEVKASVQGSARIVLNKPISALKLTYTPTCAKGRFVVKRLSLES
ncbi:MAG: hypothetical protein QW594_00655, partial [Candidatus Woesearchaeota archaeon]